MRPAVASTQGVDLPTPTVGGRLVSIFDGPTAHVVADLDASNRVWTARERHAVADVAGVRDAMEHLDCDGIAPLDYPAIDDLAILIGHDGGMRGLRRVIARLDRDGITHITHCPTPILDSLGQLRCPEHRHDGDRAKRLWAAILSAGGYRAVVRWWRVEGDNVVEVPRGGATAC